ncbi:hypothetical protein [Eisenbergiella sp.]
MTDKKQYSTPAEKNYNINGQKLRSFVLKHAAFLLKIIKTDWLVFIIPPIYNFASVFLIFADSLPEGFHFLPGIPSPANKTKVENGIKKAADILPLFFMPGFS